MKANAPEKVYLEREKETDRIHHLWSRTPVVSSLYEHIEYTRTDVLIKKAENYLRDKCQRFILTEKDIEDFVKYMKGE